jgi:SET domain-containing protein
MIHIEYKIKASETHGIGLYANQKINKGGLVYTPSPLLDVDLSLGEFESLNAMERKEVKYYGYLNHKTNKWHVAYDAIRVLNHGEDPNVTQDEDMVMTAIVDIAEGEELLQDYKEIYPNGGEHFNRK